MSITKILVPITNMIDPKLLHYTQQLATENNASLIILYITSPLTLTNYYTYPSMLYSIANMNMDSIQMAHESLAEKIDTLVGDFPHETLCLVGPTTDTILRVAEQKHVDLIVIPGPPETSSGKFMVKPKCDKLSKKTKIPVMVYRD
ncbi:MAG: universal stress protein [Cellulosilyticaceae bacterium]